MGKITLRNLSIKLLIMPYTHRKVGDKQCVYKREDNSKVGCTTGPIDKYLAALHANANESVNGINLNKIDKPRYSVEDLTWVTKNPHYGVIDNSDNEYIAEFNIHKYGKENAKRMADEKAYISNKLNGESVNEENVLKGGKADKIRNIDDLYDYWAEKGYLETRGIFKSLKKELEHQIALGKKIESEHTYDEEKIIEIVFDHLVEDKEYYTKSKPKNWANKEISKETNESTKILIKRLIRENIGFK
jgi:hypothetical protein